MISPIFNHRTVVCKFRPRINGPCWESWRSYWYVRHFHRVSQNPTWWNNQQTVQVDRDALLTLTQESLEKGVDRLEAAASQLYKALLAGRDRGAYGMTMQWTRAPNTIIRYGCYHGAFGRIPHLQYAVLQTSVWLPFHHVHSTGEYKRHHCQEL